MRKGFSKAIAYLMVFMMIFTMVPAMPAYAEAEPASDPAVEQTENDQALPEGDDIEGSDMEEVIEEESVQTEQQSQSTEEVVTKTQSRSTTEIASGTCGDNATWTLYDDGEMKISGSGKIEATWGDYSGKIKKVVIEDGITNVPASGFRDYLIEAVEIAGSVKEIEKLAFYECDYITEDIVLQEGLEIIGEGAFAGCTSVKHIELPDGVKTLGDYAFRDCWSLEELIVPDSVNSIGVQLLSGCIAIETFDIPDWMTVIPSNMFSYCRSLKTIEIPEGVTTIEACAFFECTALEELILPESVKILGVQALMNFAGTLVVLNPECEDLDYLLYLNSAAVIKGYAGSTAETFATENGFEFIKIDDNDNKCGENATWKIDADGNLIISGTGAVTDNGGFKDLEINQVVIEEGITAIGDNIFQNSSMQSLAPLPSTLESIGDYAFGGCGLGTELILPESLTEIGKYAFTSTIVSRVALPASLEVISEGAFAYSMLSYVTIPEGVTTIEACAFNWTSLLGDVVIPASVASIGTDAFDMYWGADHYVILNPECAIDQAGMNPKYGFVGYGQSKAEEYAATLPGTFIYLCDYYEKPHEYGKGTVVQEADCMNQGITEYVCSNCNKVKSEYSETDSNKHDFGKWTVEIEPTCTMAGTEIRTCSRCEATETREVAVIPHDYKDHVVPPTCLEDGYTTHTCTVCSDTYTDSVVEAVGYHQVKEWHYVTIPTATRQGEKEGTCTACKETISETLPLDPSVIDAGGFGPNGNNDVIWVLKTDGTLTISGEGPTNGFTGSGDAWRGYEQQIKKLVIEEGITEIQSNAFYGLTALTGTLELPDSITYIGSGAFGGCSGLTGKLIIPDSVTHIGYGAFQNCTGFTGLELSETLTELESSAFSGCSGLTGTLDIPGSIETVGSYAFANCDGITGLKLQYGIKSIEYGAFSGCESLNGEVIIPDSVTKISSFIDRIYTYKHTIDKLYIPESVISITYGLPDAAVYYIYEGSYVDEYIKNSAFGYDSEIRYITVSNSVKKQTEFMDLRSATIVAGVDEYINLMDYVVSDKELTTDDLEVTFDTEDYTSYENGAIYTWDPGECVITVKYGEHVSSIVLRIIDESYEKTDAKAIAFNQQEITLEKGEKYYNKPIALPLDATNTVVAWTSSAPEVVSVAQNGTITGMACGTAVITARVNDTVTAEYTVTVESPLLNIYVTDKNKNIELLKGESANLVFQTYPHDAREQVKFISSNEEVVTIDENGRVTAVNAGTVTVTLMGAGKHSVVTVKVGNPLKKISIKEYTQRIAIGESVQLETELTPSDAVLETEPVWTSSNTDIATVDQNGTVTAVKSGTADITVTVGELTATTTVYCRNTAMTSVQLEAESLEVPYGQIVALKAAKLPLNTSDTSPFAWTSDDEKVITVNEKGEIIAVGLGTANVTVYAGQYTDSCEITVTKAKPEFEIPADLELTVGTAVKYVKLPEGFEWQDPEDCRYFRGKKTFYATYTPEDTKHYKKVYDVAIPVQVVDPKVLDVDLVDALAVCTGTEYQMEKVLDVQVQDGCLYDPIWSVADESVAMLDAAGNLIAIAPGETVITLKIQDEFEETCRLVVSDHRWRGSYTIDKKPTCTETGSESIHCADCDTSKPESSREIGMLDHAYTEWIVSAEPTVEVDGEKFKECVSCGDVIKEVLLACIAYSDTNKDLKWIILPDGTLKFSGKGKIEQSTELNEYRSQITGLIIEEGITEIGDYAFQDFDGFQNDLVIPDSVTAIGNSAFALSVPGTANRTLTLSANLKTIGDNAFAGNRNLTGDLVIPASVTKIGDGAFSNCQKLESLKLSEGLVTIGASAFEHCKGLRGDLVIPDSVTTIGNSAFYNQVYPGAFDGTLKLSENLTSIGNNVFNACGFTGDLIIPDSVTEIGSYAFNNCTGFNGTLTLSENLTTIGNSAFQSCGFTGDLVIPDSVTTIGSSAFNDCDNIESITLSENLKTIEDYTFAYCASLKGDLVIPDSVTTIGNYAFTAGNTDTYGGKLILSENLTTIGAGAFSACGFTGTLTIPDSVTWIGEDSFRDCLKITDVVIKGKDLHVGDYAFNKDPNLERYYFVHKDSDAEAWINANKNQPDKVMYLDENGNPADGHAWRNATCETPKTCRVCGETEGEALGHYWNATTCTSPRVCERCRVTDGEALGHDLSEVTVEPTCQKDGYIGLACSRCDYVKKDQTFAAVKHKYGEWYEVGVATCEGWGTSRRDCTYDGCTQSEWGNIDPIGHKGEWVVVKEPTCVESGSESKTCTVCGKTEKRYLFDYTNHNWAEATCTSAQRCTRCGTTEGEPLPHDAVHNPRVQWTCTQDGNEENWYCRKCDTYYANAACTTSFAEPPYYKAYGHTPGEPATCTDAQRCATCHAELNPPTDHNWIAATCQKPAACRTCGMTKGSTAAHKYGAYKVTRKATFGKSGVQTSTCSVCKVTRTKSISAAPKTVKLSATAYTFNGKTKKPSVKFSSKFSGSYYSVTNKGGKNVGTYKVTVTLKGAYYSGSKTLTFKINPAAPTSVKVTGAKKALTVKWKKPSSTYRKQMTGYQIRYSLKSGMSGAKTVTVKSTTATSKKISKLKSKKYYYVQVRTYKKVGKITYYSAWSKAKKVKTK